MKWLMEIHKDGYVVFIYKDGHYRATINKKRLPLWTQNHGEFYSMEMNTRFPLVEVRE